MKNRFRDGCTKCCPKGGVEGKGPNRTKPNQKIKKKESVARVKQQTVFASRKSKPSFLFLILTSTYIHCNLQQGRRFIYIASQIQFLNRR